MIPLSRYFSIVPPQGTIRICLAGKSQSRDHGTDRSKRALSSHQSEGTARGTRWPFGGPARGLGQFTLAPTPLRRRAPETKLKARGEQADVVKATVHGHINNLGIGFLKHLFGFMQTERDALGDERLAKMAAKQPAEVAHAAPALPGKFFRRLMLPLAFHHLGQQCFKALFGGQCRAGGVGSWVGYGGGWRQVVGQNHCREVQHFAARQQRMAGMDLFPQLGKLLGHGAGRGPVFGEGMFQLRRALQVLAFGGADGAGQ